MIELATDVDIGSGTIHGPPGDEAAFDELVWVFAHNLAVFTGSRFALVGIHDKIARFGIFVPVFEIHEGLGDASENCPVGKEGETNPFHARGKPSATTAP